MIHEAAWKAFRPLVVLVCSVAVTAFILPPLWAAATWWCSNSRPVREIMTADVMFVRPEQTSSECMALMTENRLRHLPVMDGERVLGMVSIGDLVKDIISQQQFIIAQLENYIAGAPGH